MGEGTIPIHVRRQEVAVVVGTRPGLVMFAPILGELRARGVAHVLVHTGQHYSPALDDVLCQQLGIPLPDHRLAGVEAHRTHATQTAAMMTGLERYFLERRSRIVLVGGDANTNLAAALAARKLGLEIGHVEAGERSDDRRMPEEHNRRIIDHISDYLYATSDKAAERLRRESVWGEIVVTGNPIVDASYQARQRLVSVPNDLPPYAVLTTHREENVDDAEKLRGIFEGVSHAALILGLDVVAPLHPRTWKRLEEFGLIGWVQQLPGLRLGTALGYHEFLSLLVSARLVFTDSGGVQQEACIHRVRCVTLRENTEWTETLPSGANRLAGTEPERIIRAAQAALAAAIDWPEPFGDGHAAERIVSHLATVLERPVVG